MPRDFEYEKNNKMLYDQCGEEDGIKCKNYIICGEILPMWWFDCKGCYLCINCDWKFGTWKAECSRTGRKFSQIGKGELKTYDNIECVICLEIKKGIEQPRCDHKICIDCFKRCYYGEWENQPKFPYSKEIENQYELRDREDDLKWDIEYPLIRKYNEDYDKWQDEKDLQFKNEEQLRKCCICRK